MILKTASPLYAAALILLSGCATEYVATAKPVLKSVRPVCISKDDKLTEGTAQQVEANNLALRSIAKSRDECKSKTPTS